MLCTTKITNYFFSVVEQSKKQKLIPEEEVPEPDQKIIADLNKKGIRVLPVSRESNYLSASFVNKRAISDEDKQALLQLKRQLIWLDLRRTTASDSTMDMVAQLTALRRLNLEHTTVTDNGLKSLSSLSNLRYINFVGTKITDAGLQQLTGLKNLENVFVYQTHVTNEGVKKYSATAPKVSIDTGRYQLPKLLTDSVISKSERKK